MPAAKDAEKRIEALREKIRHHEYLYYVLDNPEISDQEFDGLMQRLKDLEAEHPSLVRPDSPTQRVGGKPREGFVKVRHSSPMLSLDNTYNEEELRDWERRVHELSGRKDVDYVCELKLDGMSLALVYEDGKLLRGDPGTRVAVGDGGIGEIWVSGKSKCQGYWNQPELSESVFNNSIAGDSDDAYSYLRTGDLGFLAEGELFVCGRLKDIIILRGQNYYPEDLEVAVEKGSEKIQIGSVAAFRGPDWEERLIVVVGLRNPSDRPHPDLVSRSLGVHGYPGRTRSCSSDVRPSRGRPLER